MEAWRPERVEALSTPRIDGLTDGASAKLKKNHPGLSVNQAKA